MARLQLIPLKLTGHSRTSTQNFIPQRPVQNQVQSVTFLTTSIFLSSADSTKRLDEPISCSEIAKATVSMQSSKCPGPDRFPSEFFKKFSQSLFPLLCCFQNLASWANCLNFFSEACITLIAKKGKDPTNCASNSPMSLLNTDAKNTTSYNYKLTD